MAADQTHIISKRDSQILKEVQKEESMHHSILNGSNRRPTTMTLKMLYNEPIGKLVGDLGVKKKTSSWILSSHDDTIKGKPTENLAHRILG